MNPGILATEMRLQLRNGFYAVYAVMTLVFFLLLAALPPGLREGGFIVIVLLDPTFMGFFFAGGLVLLERDQGVLQFVVTQGRGFRSYWYAKVGAILILALLVVGTLTAGAGLLGYIRPTTRSYAYLFSSLVLAVPLFFSLGLAFAGWKPRVLEYFVYAGIVMTPFMYPLLEFGGIPVGYSGVFSPIWGPLVCIRAAFSTGPVVGPDMEAGIGPGTGILAAAALSLVAWNVLAYYTASRAFPVLAGAVSSGPQAGRLSCSRNAHPAKPRAKTSIKPSTKRLLHPATPRLPRLLHPGQHTKPRIPADIRLLLRDRVTLMILFAPFLAAAVIGRAVPAALGTGSIAALLPDIVVSSASAWMNNLRSFALLLGVLMYGMLGAFLYLDEKDADLVPFLKTLPGRPGWFIARRSGLLLVLYVIALPGVILAGDLIHPGLGTARFIVSLALDAAGIPLMFLGVGLFASNKVQGLALAKLMNISSLPPLILIALPEPFAWVVGVFPTAWGSILRLAAPGPLQFWTAVLVGSLYSGGVLLFLYRKAIQ
jgi:fluoroquinolone transport system permease protein